MNKTLCTLAVAASLSISGLKVGAEPPPAGFHLSLGYKNLPVDYQFRHNAHPGDSFLPGASQPGSAGKTELNRLHFFAVGGGYDKAFWENWSASADVSALFGGARDRHQNANDTRPPANGAFVYSEGRFGFATTAGVSRQLGKFSLGGEFQLAGVSIESGWDRFSKDQKQSSTFKLVPSAGPKLGYRVTQNLSLDGSVQFGQGVGASVGLRWNF